LAVAFLMCVVSASSLLGTPVLAASQAPDEPPTVEETVGPDGSRVVEAEAVPLSLPTEGGIPGVAALDPSVELRSVDNLEGLPADLTPTSATEIADWRTEHSRSTLNPDGTITAEYSGGRLNYLDEDGDWQPLDLSFVPTTGDATYPIGIRQQRPSGHSEARAIDRRQHAEPDDDRRQQLPVDRCDLDAGG
jgi:hypothetical protein